MTFWRRRRLPVATVVFDSYWRFAAHRQRLFRARLARTPDPVSSDPILSTFRFTNAYRASDRVSQYLIRHVIYDRRRGFRDAFARTLLFKIFNRIETWELLASHVGDITAETVLDGAVRQVLDGARRRGERIYSAAYIMPSPNHFGSRHKHVNHLGLLRAMLTDRAEIRILGARTMAEAFDVLRAFPSIGSFLGYQLVTDLNYGPHLGFGEDEFGVPGPGARDGLRRCFSDPGDLSPDEIIRWVMETQEENFTARGISFDNLWGRPLQLIDCQNLFCEVDKYARVAHPHVVFPGARQRIKQRYRPNPAPITAWYPPKWGINDAVAAWLGRG